jgi:hypothetical protein
MGPTKTPTQETKHTMDYLNNQLDTARMSLVIITCFFISGLIDSVVFNSWSCFVNMQTGKLLVDADTTVG